MFVFFSLQMMAEFFTATQAQDGFFLNLSTLLLKMCQPFMDPCSPKLLKINPQYCAVNVSFDSIAREGTALHVIGLDGETRLVVPPNEGTNGQLCGQQGVGNFQNAKCYIFCSVLLAFLWTEMEAACKSKPGLFEKHHCSAENFAVLSILI